MRAVPTCPGDGPPERARGALDLALAALIQGRRPPDTTDAVSPPKAWRGAVPHAKEARGAFHLGRGRVREVGPMPEIVHAEGRPRPSFRFVARLASSRSAATCRARLTRAVLGVSLRYGAMLGLMLGRRFLFVFGPRRRRARTLLS